MGVAKFLSDCPKGGAQWWMGSDCGPASGEPAGAPVWRPFLLWVHLGKQYRALSRIWCKRAKTIYLFFSPVVALKPSLCSMEVEIDSPQTKCRNQSQLLVRNREEPASYILGVPNWDLTGISKSPLGSLKCVISPPARSSLPIQSWLLKAWKTMTLTCSSTCTWLLVSNWAGK